MEDKPSNESETPTVIHEEDAPDGGAPDAGAWDDGGKVEPRSFWLGVLVGAVGVLAVGGLILVL